MIKMIEKKYPFDEEYPTLDDLEAMPRDERKRMHLRELSPEELCKIIEDLEERIKDLEEQSVTDPLTGDLGMFNRRYFEAQIERELSRLRAREDDQRHPAKEYVSILFIDLNRFKDINDKLGHIKGDEVLRETARVLYENVRPSDTVCRYGGDEFVVILPGADEHGAEVVAERIYMAFERGVASKYITEVDGFGISIGMATTHYQIPVEELIEEADRHMYRMKRNSEH